MDNCAERDQVALEVMTALFFNMQIGHVPFDCPSKKNVVERIEEYTLGVIAHGITNPGYYLCKGIESEICYDCNLYKKRKK